MRPFCYGSRLIGFLLVLIVAVLFVGRVLWH
jgi:hypothetical protein